MAIHIEYETELSLGIDAEPVITKVIDMALEIHQCTYACLLYTSEEILEEDGITIDEEGFQAAMTEQKEKARKARKTTNYMGADVTVYQSIDAAVTSEFVGYDYLTCESPITVLTTESEVVEALVDGQQGTIFTEQTPFYATSGGQEGDNGIISIGDSVFEVKDTIKLQGGKIGHVGVVTSGMFKVGDKVTLASLFLLC